ncbi:hypothetical protein UK23_31000 [Lentzea aerocolonigenes]|uniref:RING-type domain-containing protein n=1 Tax=Lentzea aerocolonigenes TaxID=68170 RepID=A0A0F0GN82_LENAE|nr:RING finger domain-containing protein [Lentzea aerocolonigenes]KJK44031.1 hypothetical protein UK23_31000 [Lentzea aerocolonigenes]
MKIIDFDHFPLLRGHFDQRGSTVHSAVEWVNNLWSYGEFASDDLVSFLTEIATEVDAARAAAPAECDSLDSRIRHLLELECSPCCTPLMLELRTPVSVLQKCGHAFHTTCIAEWFVKASRDQVPWTCPNCRREVDTRSCSQGLMEEFWHHAGEPGLGDAISNSMISVRGIEVSAELRRLVLEFNAGSGTWRPAERTERLELLRAAVDGCDTRARQSFDRAMETAAELQACLALCARIDEVCAAFPGRRSAPDLFIAAVADHWTRHSLMNTLERLRDGVAALDLNYRDVLGTCDLDTLFRAVRELHLRLAAYRDEEDAPALLDELELLHSRVVTALQRVQRRLLDVGDEETRVRGEIDRVREQLRDMGN